MINVQGSIIVIDRTSGDVQLSTHFNSKEFACKDGSRIIFISDELLEVLEEIREHFNKPITINSGYRTIAYNKKVGGVTNSKHCMGLASDIKITGVTPREIYSYIDSLYPNIYGLGLYDTFVHIDVRHTKARW